ncbi:PadR family transcriptional regulator [Paenibacillus albiflavus]|uniref:PadR family transcriptional regulator n=1 Tax=Paenibacillus albiflavus TaxID=2545760 RepID=A0A4V2WNS7_9BACL|nr:PadR family transcriptional regulator [Paenibacillus albiflavus]TCZ76602.1 PadR family transcriptional regulator [Paenibacillus albiflavus]
MLENIILGLLMEGELSGYDIKKTIDSTIGMFYKASYGSLYPALGRLTSKGLVSVTELENSKNKKLYRILPSGKEMFLAWLAEPLQISLNEHLLKIFFYDYLDEETRQVRLNEYGVKLETEIRRMQAVEQIVTQELKQVEDPNSYYYRVSVLTYGSSHFQMSKQWIQNIKERK